MDKITQPAQIVGILKKIHKRRAMLSISVPGTEKHYSSAILEIKSAGTFGHLIIDELTPKDGHALLLNARKLKARLQLDGVKISFSTTLESSGKDSGIAFYTLALPQEMDYLQQRAHHRVRPSLTKPLATLLIHEDETVFHGEVYDISAGGLSIKLKSNALATPLKPTDILICSFTLPHGEEITCKLEIRSIHATNQQNFIRIGVRFTNLASTVQKIIQRYIANIEREHLKKMPHDT